MCNMRIAQNSNRVNSITVRRVQPAAGPFRDDALVFFTTWSFEWQELFPRAVPQVFAEACAAAPEAVFDLIPAAWAASGMAASSFWLAPFSKNRVHTLAAAPSTFDLRSSIFGDKGPVQRARCTPNGTLLGHGGGPDGVPCFELYVNENRTYSQSRGSLCYRRTRLCNFGAPAGRLPS
jgi:hypothetical protein